MKKFSFWQYWGVDPEFHVHIPGKHSPTEFVPSPRKFWLVYVASFETWLLCVALEGLELAL